METPIGFHPKTPSGPAGQVKELSQLVRHFKVLHGGCVATFREYGYAINMIELW